ncbi:hypothetical protein H257_02499 [Aphanomyces astaci]|uniref:Chromodomain-helicase-DNA-binding protein 6 n=1 Tax=Aphanomyces astaci TaxID=112090 RepID=W4H1V4_APHAT|nr:hypothetical protein H257_02499 [Aphanomyces astaci]ETV86000.1 hypothetical protein H257_02499 [Aphanomyces astaci]|eukprot:XP_009824472.1 hypothetical protein H257_02499 [Aphanomyces astaci]
MADAAPVPYCVCQNTDGAGIMIECIRNTGGCNGWVHPTCCGLLLTEDELEAIDSYICPMCESPTDDYTKMKAVNTKRANKLALKAREQQQKGGAGTSTSTSSSSKKEKKRKREEKEDKDGGVYRWKCKGCSQKNDPASTACASCDEPRKKHKHKKSSKSHHTSDDDETKVSSGDKKDKKRKREKKDKKHKESRRSHRSDPSSKKAYHVPGSDDDDFSDGSEAEVQFKQPPILEPVDSPAVPGDATLVPASVNNVGMVVMTIERIMGHKPVADPSSATSTTTPSSSFVYFIKWKGYSYIHATWESDATLLQLDPTNKHKIKRYLEKSVVAPTAGGGPPRALDSEDDVEYFNPEYLEIHRILDMRRDSPPLSSSDQVIDDGWRYYIKWRVLSYAECTWERACDIVDDDAIKKFRKRTTLPPDSSSVDKPPIDPLARPSLREFKKLETSPLFGENKSFSLRAYQLEGLNWLRWNWYNSRASVLADEMGLGKTIQTLAFLDDLRVSQHLPGPFLVVAPLSLIAQWQSECETWTDMDCVVYHGSSEAREIIQRFEFYHLVHGKLDKRRGFKFHILVTTYEIAIKDIGLLSKIQWQCLVVDEAHRLKNQSSRLVEQMRSLRRAYCVLLTGTPLQNKTEELWALLNFLDPIAFPSLATFLGQFGSLQDASQVADLHKLLKPYLLRRVKEDVEKSLPPKEETIIEVELTAVQKQWYRAIYERNTAFLMRGQGGANVPNLMNVMMELRKCCNHPYLNNGVEDAICERVTTDAERFEMLVKCCGKMVLLDKLLPKLKEGGHKVLIFSQMVRVLDLLEDYIRGMGYLYERLDGNIRGNERQAAVDRFVKPEYQRFIMMLSTKAGGLGLNLTAADTVIIYDSDWNPQNDLQAQARAHRIGQTHSVKIYRLITRKTYEMHMFHKASLKLGLDRAVLTHMRQEQDKESKNAKAMVKSKAQEAQEIDELLKRGAYDVFRDDDEASEQFCAADIDTLLQRSSQIVEYESQARGSFSKASFVSAATSDDVDIDDPDFWKKAVGLAEPDVLDEAASLVLSSQRKRTRVARFGTKEALSDDDDDDDKDVTTTKKDADKPPKPEVSREWTVNGRDRLQRALMHFGFGRWEIIRSQSGGSRTVEEVEMFARAFVLVCGLCCAGVVQATDAPFVQSAILAASHAKHEYMTEAEAWTDHATKTIPLVLQEEEFVLKLKQGGARRVLSRLDILSRLQVKLVASCVALEKERDGDEPPHGLVDLDARVEFLGLENVLHRLEFAIGSDRPQWSNLTPWWDYAADKSLCMGVFLHGYGRCAQIISDPRLCFHQREQSVTADNPLAAEDKPKFPQPEVQQMNRLLIWLLSIEDAQRQKQQEKKEKSISDMQKINTLDQSQKLAAQRRQEAITWQFLHLDLMRHTVSLGNANVWHAIREEGTTKMIKEWSTAERKSICYVLSTRGAPLVVDSASQWSWYLLVSKAHVYKSAMRAQRYVYDRVLAKCKELIVKESSALSRPNEIQFVDPYQAAALHGAKAKQMAFLLLRRTQMYRTVSYLLQHERDEVDNYLRSGDPGLTDHMPVWWCPWIHDVALLEGMLIHGVGSYLELHRHDALDVEAVAAFVRRVFVQGDGPQHPPVIDPVKFHSAAEQAAWVRDTSVQFPPVDMLEKKVMRVCLSLTEELPTSHEAKFSMENDVATAVLPMTMMDVVVKEQRTERATANNHHSSAQPQVEDLTVFLAQTKASRDVLCEQQQIATH